MPTQSLTPTAPFATRIEGRTKDVVLTAPILAADILDVTSLGMGFVQEVWMRVPITNVVGSVGPTITNAVASGATIRLIGY